MASKKEKIGERAKWVERMRVKGAGLGVEVVIEAGRGRHFQVRYRSKRICWGAGTVELEAYLAGMETAKKMQRGDI